MDFINRHKTYLLVLSIFSLSFLIQTNLLASWDVSWGLHETKKLLAGGHYGKEIFELSPPMFLYLYSPVIFLTKIFSINIFSALKSYVFALGFLSLFACYDLSKKIFSSNILVSVFISALAIIFFLLPLPYDFGQREHLLVILIMPYLLTLACRLRKIAINKWFAIVIGLMAGLGFSIKPFYLLTLVFIELYAMICRRDWFSWWRMESIVVFFMLSIYALVIYYNYAAYLSSILTLASHTYYQGYGSSSREIFFRSSIYYCCLPFLLCFIQSQYKFLIAILMFALSGFLIAYGLQKTIWYYHLLPAYSISFLLLVLLFNLFVTQKNIAKFNYAVIAFLMLIFDLRYMKEFFEIPLLYPMLFFMLGAIVLLAKNKWRALFSAILGVLIFVYPVYSMMDRYWYASGYKKIMTPLLMFMQRNMHYQTVYFLATTMTYEFPVIDYAQATPVSKYPELLWLPGYLKQAKIFVKDHDYFVTSVADELITQEPRFVFVDVLPNKLYLDGISFDFIKDFSENAKFRKAWSGYRYMTTVDNYPAYKLQVYERVM